MDRWSANFLILLFCFVWFINNYGNDFALELQSDDGKGCCCFWLPLSEEWYDTIRVLVLGGEIDVLGIAWPKGKVYMN